MIAANAALPAPTKRAIVLSDGDRQIVELVSKGMSNADIAEQLGLRYASVAAIICKVSKRVGACNRERLGAWYRSAA